MADHARPGTGRRTIRAARAAGLFLIVSAVAAGLAPAVLAAPPIETCEPGQTVTEGGIRVCSPAITDGGGFAIGGLLPIIVALVVGAGLALVGAYFVLRRRAGGPLDPVDAGEWWTCSNCGRSNVVGSPRCYACGTWQGGSRPEKASTEP